MRIINEPIIAALVYGIDYKSSNEKIFQFLILEKKIQILLLLTFMMIEITEFYWGNEKNDINSTIGNINLIAEDFDK